MAAGSSCCMNGRTRNHTTSAATHHMTSHTTSHTCARTRRGRTWVSESESGYSDPDSDGARVWRGTWHFEYCTCAHQVGPPSRRPCSSSSSMYLLLSAMPFSSDHAMSDSVMIGSIVHHLVRVRVRARPTTFFRLKKNRVISLRGAGPAAPRPAEAGAADPHEAQGERPAGEGGVIV